MRSAFPLMNGMITIPAKAASVIAAIRFTEVPVFDFGVQSQIACIGLSRIAKICHFYERVL